MSEPIRSVLVGTAGLSVVAVVAAFLTITRAHIDPDRDRRRAAARFARLVAGVQAAHFVEEFATGFHRRFPELLGLAPWPSEFFVTFNVCWLAIWILSSSWLVAGRRAALFPLWFLAIGCAANGVAHPLLAGIAGGYFPGLVSSPIVGVAGVVLVRRLLAITPDGEPTVAAV